MERLKGIAAGTGVVKVNFVSGFLVDDQAQPTVAHLVVETVGHKRYVPGLEGPAGLPLLSEERVRRAWREADVRAVTGGNDLRLFPSELGVPPSGRG